MRSALAVLALLVAKNTVACSAMSWNPNDVIENAPECSANGRFCVVVRWYPVPDFKSELADVVFERERQVSDRVTAVLYEGRTLISTMTVGRWTAREMLIADSGRYIVAVRGVRGECGSHMDAETVLTEIHRADGTHVATLRASDLFAVNDVERLEKIDWELRPVSDVRELLILHVGNEERRIDLATGALLDPKRPIYAPPRVTVTAADAAHVRPYEESQCASAFAAADVVRLSSQELLARAIEAPVPEYARIARLARVEGWVAVDVLVNEAGVVVCTRNTKGIFGMAAAAADGLRRWQFRRGSKVAGELLVRFELAGEP